MSGQLPADGRDAGKPTASGAPDADTPGDGLSGVDLARVALRAAKEQARARGAATQQKKQARRGACAAVRAPTAAIRCRWVPRSAG